MVVHDPGPWFDDVLAGLARQDYANLKFLLLLTGEPGDLPDRIAAAVPRAFVRAVEGNVGFGPTANGVLGLVEGDNGFFCFLHDDVALEPDAIRLLVEELYRSNAGVVGPKLVTWNDTTVLQHVGYGVDRFGEFDPIIEPGETDQEQHDAVRDVFALPSACLLVRADLFRSLGGFDEQISYHGEDVDLCWRAHHHGARVVVVPSAKARHLEQLVHRRPDLPHDSLRARHRVRAVATLTGARRLPLLSVQLVVVSLVQFVIGVVTGHGGSAWASVRALLGLVPRIPTIIGRRRTLAPGRLVPDREVVGLQMRGIARVSSYLRSRDARPDPVDAGAKAWRQRSGAGAAIGWAVITAAIVVGSRHLLTGGVPAFGEFLPFDPSPQHLWQSYTSGWNSRALGSSSSSPTGLGIIAAGSVLTMFRMGLLHTVSIVGLLLVGAVGMWRLTSSFSTNRARLVSTVVYLAVPLPAQLISVGRWGALLCYAALPWSVDAMRRLAGLHAGPDDEDGERTIGFGVRGHVQALASGALVAAFAVAFEPAYLVVLIGSTVLIAVATTLTGAPGVAALRLAIAGLVAALVAVVLNLPWLIDHLGTGGWTAIIGPAPVADRGYSVLDLATFHVGNGTGVVLAIALYLPVIAAVLLGRGWRLGWAVRGAFMVVGFAWLAVLDDSSSFLVRLPEPGVLLVPVALGVALAAGCVAGSLELDVRGGSFGWRQPFSILCTAALVVGVIPGVLALSSGRWDTPRSTLVDLTGQFPSQPPEGDYRILWVGDQRVLPAAASPYRSGIGYAITNDRVLTVADTFGIVARDGDDDVIAALDAIASGSTTRAGRLLGPFAIRYVVVPVIDGAVSRSEDPVPVPAGLLDALGDQLDLAAVYSPPNFIVYENRAWLPVRSVLTADGVEASNEAGAAALARADPSGATPIMVGADHLTRATVDVPAGTVHLAVPFDRAWQLDVDGAPVEARPAFGATMAFDSAAAGQASLRYDTPASRRALVIAQVLGFLLVALAATDIRLRRPRMRARVAAGPVEPVLTFDPLMQKPEFGLETPDLDTREPDTREPEDAPDAPDEPDEPDEPEAPDEPEKGAS